MISIVVPIYKVKNEYLKNCLESILGQTYNDIEVIIINDGMSEDNNNLVSTYKNKYDNLKIIGEGHHGVSYARNKGIREARGEWIVFVDADDYINKDFCIKMIKEASVSNADLIISGYNRVYKNSSEKINCNQKIIYNNDIDYLIDVLNVQKGLGFCHTKLWNLRKIKENNIYFNEDIVVGEDALFCMQMAEIMDKIVILPEPLYNYRFNFSSVVRKYDTNYPDKYLKSMEYAKEYIEKKYKNSELVKNNFWNYVMYHFLLIAVNYCFNPSNGKNSKEQKDLLRNLCKQELFNEAIKNSNYKKLSLTRKITLFTIKHKLYFWTSSICKIRQMQFRQNTN